MTTSQTLPTSPSSSSAGVSFVNIDQMKPDDDTIKMFCGQIPRQTNESELREIFEQFGSICQLDILRDKQTGESKGCCFVTFQTRKSALDAQNALHNLRTLEGSHHPIQMKPADVENRNERKLFIGMVSKNFDEQTIRSLFQSYGSIEDCTILRDVNGKSRGCAFITFHKRQYAMNAIRSMHQSQTMEGCSSPLVVKFADTPKDKDTKNTHQQYINCNHIHMQQPGHAILNPLLELGNLVYLQQLLKNYGLIGNNDNTINYPALNNLLQMFNTNTNLNGNKVPILVPSNPSSSNSHHENNPFFDIPDQQRVSHSPRKALSSNFNDNSHNNNINDPSSSSRYSPAMPPLYATGISPSGNTGADTYHNLQSRVTMSQVNNGGLSSRANSSGQAPTSFPMFPSPSYRTPQVASKHTEGPDGANLFIYHLPQEYNDIDLAQAFAPYGPIVSAKVFVDRMTNRSKCFGFVSYDNLTSAQSAINQMNGYQIGLKRLTVQLKKLRIDRNHSTETSSNNNSNNINRNSPTTPPQ